MPEEQGEAVSVPVGPQEAGGEPVIDLLSQELRSVASDAADVVPIPLESGGLIEAPLIGAAPALAGAGMATVALSPSGLVPNPMAQRTRRSIGGYLIGSGVALLAAMPWVWSLAARVIAAPASEVRASFFGFGFSPTAEFCLLLVVLLTAMLGSFAVLSMTFSSRAGHETLERGYVWWYLTRPISAAALALLFYMAVTAGFADASVTRDRPGLVVAAAIGGIAGLSTDQVLKKMRSAFGLLPMNESASDKDDSST